MLLSQLYFTEEKTYLGVEKACVPWPGSNRTNRVRSPSTQCTLEPTRNRMSQESMNETLNYVI